MSTEVYAIFLALVMPLCVWILKVWINSLFKKESKERRKTERQTQLMMIDMQCLIYVLSSKQFDSPDEFRTMYDEHKKNLLSEYKFLNEDV